MATTGLFDRWAPCIQARPRRRVQQRISSSKVEGRPTGTVVYRLRQPETRRTWLRGSQVCEGGDDGCVVGAGCVAAAGGICWVDRRERRVDDRLRGDPVQLLDQGVRDEDVVDEFRRLLLGIAVGPPTPEGVQPPL